VPVFDPVKWMASSWDIKFYDNRHGQICATIRNPGASVAATFTAQHDIIAIKPTPRRQEYANVVRYRYAPLHAPPVATKLEGAEGEAMPARSFHDHAAWGSGLQTLSDSAAITANGGEEVYLDLDMYGVRDQATADMYAARALARAVGPADEGPVAIALVTGLQGLQVSGTDIEIGSKIAATHVEGLGASGFVAAQMIVEEIDVDPDTCAVTLTCDLL
jgi:hypothetical protein